MSSTAPHLRIGPSTILPRLTLVEALRLFLADMERRGCRPLSVQHFRRYAEGCIAHAGWVYADDLTLAGAVEWLAFKREKGWSGTTHDGAVSALRCFGRFIAAMGHSPGNQLANLAGSGEQGEPGARALTATEVRRLVAVAYAAQTSGDRRNEKSCRALVYAFAALTGLRHAECRAIRWCDIDLGPTPYIVCNQAWTKNGRRSTVAMNPEIAHLLRWHRDGTPHEQNDRIFATFPHRPTFRRDRDDAGIPEKDGRGRLASFHSFRKFFDTELDRLSTPAGVRLALMRHSGGLDGRYLDHPDDAQVLAVSKLPLIWPVPPVLSAQKSSGFVDSPSCKWGRNGDTNGAVSDAMNHSSTASSSPASPQGEGHSNLPVHSARRGTGGRHDASMVRLCPLTAQSGAEHGQPDLSQGPGYVPHNRAEVPAMRAGVHCASAAGEREAEARPVLFSGLRVQAGSGHLECREGPADHPGIDAAGTDTGQRAHQHANPSGRDGETHGLRGLRRDGEAPRHAPRGLQQTGGGYAPLSQLPHEAAQQETGGAQGRELTAARAEGASDESRVAIVGANDAVVPDRLGRNVVHPRVAAAQEVALLLHEPRPPLGDGGAVSLASPGAGVIAGPGASPSSHDGSAEPLAAQQISGLPASVGGPLCSPSRTPGYTGEFGDTSTRQPGHCHGAEVEREGRTNEAPSPPGTSSPAPVATHSLDAGVLWRLEKQHPQTRGAPDEESAEQRDPPERRGSLELSAAQRASLARQLADDPSLSPLLKSLLTRVVGGLLLGACALGMAASCAKGAAVVESKMAGVVRVP